MDNRQSSPFGAPAFGGGVPTISLRRPSAERRRSDQFDRLLTGSEPPPPHRSRAERLPSFQSAFGDLAGNRGAVGGAYQHGPYGPPNPLQRNTAALGGGNSRPYGGFDRPRDPFQLGGRNYAPGRDRAQREMLYASSRDNVYNNVEERDLRRQVGEPWGVARLGEFQRARGFRR